jgi:hypothetical protein
MRNVLAIESSSSTIFRVAYKGRLLVAHSSNIANILVVIDGSSEPVSQLSTAKPVSKLSIAKAISTAVMLLKIALALSKTSTSKKTTTPKKAKEAADTDKKKKLLTDTEMLIVEMMATKKSKPLGGQEKSHKRALTRGTPTPRPCQRRKQAKTQKLFISDKEDFEKEVIEDAVEDTVEVNNDEENAVTDSPAKRTWASKTGNKKW